MNMEQGQKIEYEQPELAKPKEATPEEPTKLESSPARARSYLDILAIEAKKEFPPEIQALIEKRQTGGVLSPEENSLFDRTLNEWRKERFGAFPPLQSRKDRLMARLYADLSDFDKGREPERFREKKRRIIRYDESKDMYFVLSVSRMRYLEIGDILSDYAWGIKYAPDKDMPPQVARHLAKRIIINETRREIEKLHDQELIEDMLTVKGHVSIANIAGIWDKVGPKKRHKYAGFLAEAMCREYLSRVSVNQKLDFVVLRANAMEDHLYKYDFIIRFLQRSRGVAVEPSEEAAQRDLKAIKKLGIQFTIASFRENVKKKKHQIARAKKAYGKDMPVDDIILMNVPTREFEEAFAKWKGGRKPSGGPEQFLSQELKDDLLKKATAGLVKV